MSDGPARFLGFGVRLLPGPRQEWGRAMLAELGAIESTPDRWRFALSCTRSALTLPSAILARRLLVASAAAGAIALAARIPLAGVRWEAMAMMAVLVAVAWLARRVAVFGPVAGSRAARAVSAGGLAVIAAEVLIFLDDARASNRGPGSATTLIAVWTAMLAIYALTLARLTARRSNVTAYSLATGAAAAVAAAAAWLIASVADPHVPASSGPALLAIAAAAICAGVAGARRGEHRLAPLSAAAGAALLIAVMIDGPLRLFPAWVSNSAPPIDPGTAERLIDPVGIWLLGCLLATALLLISGARRERAARGFSLTP